VASDKDRGKKHQVFERSFDGKLTTTNHFFFGETKLYSSQFLQWNGGLVANPVAYKYSPAKYYIGECRANTLLTVNN